MPSIKIGKLKCQLCNYTWVPRKEQVFQCPGCRRVGWYKKPKDKKVPVEKGGD